jgi:hypothetical protein
MIKIQLLAFLVLSFLANIAIADVVHVDCPSGRVEGTRTDDNDGVKTSADGVAQQKLDYIIDTENSDESKVTYGLRTVPVETIHRHGEAITIFYFFNNVPYMDTIYPNGLIYSTEHRIFFDNVAITWNYQCNILK